MSLSLFGGSDSAGYGAAANAAVNLAEYVLGTNTTSNSITNSNGSSSSTSNSFANTSVSSLTNTNTDVESESETNTLNTDTNTVVNSADPGVIASLKALAQTAINNSSDPTKTQGLISGILQQAGDAMTTIFGQQKQAGVYDSSATTSQNNDIMSRAAADAAQAVLGYQTTEQGIANSALNQLLQATATKTTTDVQQDQSTTLSDQDTNQTVADSATTSVVGGQSSTAQQQTTSSTSSSSHSGLSVVCTFMHQKKLLSSRRYYVVSDSLLRMPQWQQDGYQMVAPALVRILIRDHTTLLARAIMSIFAHRTEYICATRGLRGCKKTWKGWAAKKLVTIYCTPSSLLCYAISKFQLFADRKAV